MPVFGFRPILSDLLLIEKVPKEEIFTDSPVISVSDIFSKTVSSRSEDSLRDNPTSW
jgi:hypothetical protein